MTERSTHVWVEQVKMTLGGAEDIIQRTVNLLHHATLGHSQPKGVVLSGKPGTGKTALALTLAKYSQLPFFVINCPDLFMTEEGASEAKLKSIFTTALQHKTSILILDEMDILAGTLTKATGLEARLGSLLLSLIDTMPTKEGHCIFVIGNSLGDTLGDVIGDTLGDTHKALENPCLLF
ncbi:P-loop containing nucleoside triphosphate hydrolase protein [Spinellus fusiger]|nr:P-loop containing nucleoside triphosphate hydrolase protein [Spinellus fusiger]